MIKQLFLSFFLVVTLSSRVLSQGCSDAGFCSLGALKNVADGSQPKRMLDIGFNFGYGEQKTITYNPYIQYGVVISERVSIQGKLTSTYANGFLGSKFNLGDVYGVVTYTPTNYPNSSLRLIGGIKIPLTTANDKNAAGLALPLDYQSSIGTYDVIAGVNYIYSGHLEVDAALQVPVIQNNKSSFFPDNFPPDSRLNNFPPTNQFRRRPDVLFRLGYYINLPASFSLKPNLLAIYHTGNDSYLNRTNMRVELINSQGLTLNEGVNITKQFGNNNRLELIAAMPVIGRKLRPDGLTRKWVLNVQYSIAF
nr:hypothetical protein [uncultured Mucilaginibacter sp.]